MSRTRFATAIIFAAGGLALFAAPASAQTADDLLRARPFAPTDRAIFTHFVYPNTPSDVPAQGTPLSEAQARAALQSYLKVQFPGNTAAQNAALAVYDNATAKQKIETPQLRASFAALKGTIGEPAINYFLNAKTGSGNPLFVHAYSQGIAYDFAAIVQGDTSTPDQDDQKILFNNVYASENPFLLTAVWMHEPLHSDISGNFPLYEER